MKKKRTHCTSLIKPAILSFILLCTGLNGQSQTANAAFKFPFPQNYPYRYGTKIQFVGANEQLQLLYSSWKSQYYEETKDKKMARIKQVDSKEMQGFNTTSQDIGYGMLISLWMENSENRTKQMFDRLYAYYTFNKDELSNKLMRSKVIGFAGTVAEPIENNKYSNTTADCDVATALIFAAHQWPADSAYYRAEANKLLDAIWLSEISVADYHVKPSDELDEKLNPSSFLTNAFDLFHRLQPWRDWDKVRDKSYSILKTVANSQTGLIPDWINNDAQYSLLTVSAQTPQFTSYVLNNAVTIPWRMATAYSWYGNEDAKTIASKITNWASTAHQDNPAKIVDGYFLDGTPFSGSQVELSSTYPTQGTQHNPSFTAGLGIGGMVDSARFKKWTADLWTAASQVDAYGTTQTNTLQLLIMLYLTGNTPNVTDIDPIVINASLYSKKHEVTVQFNKELDSSSIIASLSNFSISDKNKTYTPLKIKKSTGNSFVITLPPSFFVAPYYLNYQGTSLYSAEGKQVQAFSKYPISEYLCGCGVPFPLSAKFDTTDKRITLAMDKELDGESIVATNFMATLNGTPINIVSATSDKLNAKQILFLLDNAVDKYSDTVKLYYIGAELRTSSYIDAEQFMITLTNWPVNPPKPTAHAISAETTTDGIYVFIKFSDAMDKPTLTSGVTLSYDGNTTDNLSSFKSLTLKSNDSTILIGQLTHPIRSSTTQLKLQYDKTLGDIIGHQTAAVESFTIEVINNFEEIRLSNNSAAIHSVSVAPNPTNNQLSIMLPQGIIPHHINLVGNDGKTITLPIPSLSETTYFISVADIPKGIYVLLIETNQDMLYNTVIIK